MTTAPYLLDNRASDARPRFAALSALFDAGTARHLDDLGVGPGWRCWEVGAGGPAVPRLLADQVDPGGTVLATDVDVSHLTGTALPAAVTVQRHDVAVDPRPLADSTWCTPAWCSPTCRLASRRSAGWRPHSVSGGGCSWRTSTYD
jgi:hypothetical protein